MNSEPHTEVPVSTNGADTTPPAPVPLSVEETQAKSEPPAPPPDMMRAGVSVPTGDSLNDYQRAQLQIEHWKLEVEMWKKTVDVQQHFNDLEMRIRNFAITLLAAVLGAAGVAAKEGTIVVFLGRYYRLAGWFLVIGFVAWFSFYLMDRYWYHHLLKGAVRHGAKIEKRLGGTEEQPGEFPSIRLGTTISEESPLKLKLLPLELHSSGKVNVFYLPIALGLLIAAWFIG